MAGSSDEIEFPQELYDAVDPPPGGLSPKEMLELDLAHARRVHAGDLEAQFEHSFVDEPVYENFPRGIRIQGREAVRAMKELASKDANGLVLNRATWPPEIRAVAFGHNVMMLETKRMHRLPDGTERPTFMVAVIPYEGDRLVGERVYRDHYGASLTDYPDSFFSVPGVELL